MGGIVAGKMPCLGRRGITFFWFWISLLRVEGVGGGRGGWRGGICRGVQVVDVEARAWKSRDVQSRILSVMERGVEMLEEEGVGMADGGCGCCGGEVDRIRIER